MKFIAVGLAGFFLAAAPAGAKTVNIEYVLDASGSMLEKVGDEMKIDIAKQTLSELVGRLPRGSSEIELNVGLRVYGHQTIAGDTGEARCRDSALEIPVKGVEPEAIKNRVAAVNARGWTPIAYSLQQAKNDFPAGPDNDNVIILISDGKETCGGDFGVDLSIVNESSVIGKSYPRKDGAEKVHGRIRYTDDLKPAGTLHAALLTSPHGHAEIVSIDTSAAAAAPGVRGAATGEDFPYLLGIYLGDKSPLARGKVRQFGEPVAAVIEKAVETAAGVRG